VSDEYRKANDMEFAECNCDENYELLVGPAGWQCLLTEPEDRRWHRDLEPVVDELNRLRAEVERLRMNPGTWIDEESACESAFARSGAPHDWPEDEPATVTRMSLSMSAECVRLRAQVERLRMTEAEREAVASGAAQCSAFGLFKIAGFLLAIAERHRRDAAPIV